MAGERRGDVPLRPWTRCGEREVGILESMNENEKYSALALDPDLALEPASELKCGSQKTLDKDDLGTESDIAAAAAAVAAEAADGDMQGPHQDGVLDILNAHVSHRLFFVVISFFFSLHMLLCCAWCRCWENCTPT